MVRSARPSAVQSWCGQLVGLGVSGTPACHPGSIRALGCAAAAQALHAGVVNQLAGVHRITARLSARCGVVNGTRIISKKVLSSVACPFLNTHAGITPLYRGVHGGFWALANNDAAHCGASVHVVDAGIDTGGIVAQAMIYPTTADNFATYPLLQLAAGLPLLAQAVDDVLAGRLQIRPAPAGPSRLWSHPTLSQYLRACLRGVY